MELLDIATQILLSDSSNTCVVYNLETNKVYHDRGIVPLLKVVDEYSNVKAVVADLIIGKAAALLCVKAGITAVYGKVMSKDAITIFKTYNIEYCYETLTDKIINRQGNDICPMEKTVLNINDYDEAYLAIKNKVLQLGRE